MIVDSRKRCDVTDHPLRLFVPYLALSLVQLVVLYSGPGWAVTTSKALLMPLLAAAVVVALRRPRPELPKLDKPTPELKSIVTSPPKTGFALAATP